MFHHNTKILINTVDVDYNYKCQIEENVSHKIETVQTNKQNGLYTDVFCVFIQKLAEKFIRLFNKILDLIEQISLFQLR